jgi:amino acid permease
MTESDLKVPLKSD